MYTRQTDPSETTDNSHTLRRGRLDAAILKTSSSTGVGSHDLRLKYGALRALRQPRGLAPGASDGGRSRGRRADHHEVLKVIVRELGAVRGDDDHRRSDTTALRGGLRRV